MTEHDIPYWLQKELDSFGVVSEDTPITKNVKQDRYASSGWVPSYPGEEPPF